jgi:hypothetical protein
MGVSGHRHAPAALYPRKWTHSTHWTEDWVGPKAGLDTEARGKIICLCQGSNLGRTFWDVIHLNYSAGKNTNMYPVWSRMDAGELTNAKRSFAITPVLPLLWQLPRVLLILLEIWKESIGMNNEIKLLPTFYPPSFRDSVSSSFLWPN